LSTCVRLKYCFKFDLNVSGRRSSDENEGVPQRTLPRKFNDLATVPARLRVAFYRLKLSQQIQPILSITSAQEIPPPEAWYQQHEHRRCQGDEEVALSGLVGSIDQAKEDDESDDGVTEEAHEPASEGSQERRELAADRIPEADDDDAADQDATPDSSTRPGWLLSNLIGEPHHHDDGYHPLSPEHARHGIPCTEAPRRRGKLAM
jgi:hypothetical protein